MGFGLKPGATTDQRLCAIGAPGTASARSSPGWLILETGRDGARRSGRWYGLRPVVWRNVSIRPRAEVRLQFFSISHVKDHYD